LRRSTLKAAIKSIEEVTKEGKASYGVLLETEMMIDKEKQKVQLHLTSDGKLTASQKLIAVKDLPKAVTDALEKKYPKTTIKRANETVKEDKVTYVAILETDAKTILAVLDGEGKILKDVSQDRKKDKK